MSTTFHVHGPLDVPTYRGKAARLITEENGRAFWRGNPAFARGRGCYVFGVRAGRGTTPLYVGMARHNFAREVFSHHKLTRYQQGLADYSRGTPILFFMTLPERRGRANVSAIR